MKLVNVSLHNALYNKLFTSSNTVVTLSVETKYLITF